MTHDLRVFCDHQDVLSHARCARDYNAILRTLCTVVENPADAEVALLHHEPSYYRGLLEDFPALRKLYRIGYCVWEASVLPQTYERGIALMDELWTASAYCHEIFSGYHANVTWVPHLAEVTERATPEGRHALETLIDTRAHHFNYLTITKEYDRRKNIQGLVDAFGYVSRRVPGARLIIKTIRYPLPADPTPRVGVHGPIVIIEGRLDGGVMGALYALSQVYVGAHMSEGWGLPLSDAMVLGKPVVATGYSGNMDFMTEANSLLVSYTVENIRPEHVYFSFDARMRWAYPHRESLEHQLIAAYRMAQDGSLNTLVQQATQDIALYDRAHLTRHIAQQLERIAAKVRGRAPSGTG